MPEPTTTPSDARGAAAAPAATHETAPPGRRRPGTVALVGALLLGVLSFQLNASMVTPALPDIADYFGVGPESVAQVQSLFFLAGAISGPLMGRWSDFIGRRRALLIVIAVMSLGTMLCLAAPTLEILVAGRFLQGFSSAIFALSYIVMQENLTRAAFGTAVGVLASVNGGVAGFDGYLGGLMTESFGFRSIFWVVLGLAAIAAVAIVRIVPAKHAQASTGRMDWWGATLLSAFLIALTYFVNAGSESGWASPKALALLAATAAAFALFIVVEQRRSSPLIAVHHLRSRPVWTVVASTVLTLAGIFAIMNFTIVVLSQDSEHGFGLAPSTAALLYLTPAALIGVFAAPLAGWLTARIGWVTTLRIGSGFTLLVAAVAAVFVEERWVVLAAVAALGIFYNGFFLTAINGLSALLSPKEAPGTLPGINGASFGIGASLGVVLVAPSVARAADTGYGPALWISVSIAAAAFAVGLLIPKPDADA
ncbi:MFS transporter [Zhihengliuella salsuginis]|uniref:MFS transporter n=1 Tax=Zhihengliuella salsuginis TaxID=578222 RepID=A0ABQ3GL84_9MICC|nr:MFS transporter [Zhihengliuella salsuginis]GHD09494.1 MFS transporter [Zhihengliuella salsuginis]